MRLIDADALTNKSGDWYVDEGTEEGFIGDLKNLIDEQPTIEPEQKKGKWIDNTYCSECGWVHETDPGFIGSVDGFNFCPQCGADMRGDKDAVD